jgi:retron-type reverse transcriptase
MPGQLGLALDPAGGEAPGGPRSGEAGRATQREDRSRVRRNKGRPGIDDMTVAELAPHLRVHWPMIREALLAGTYRPSAVR